MEGNRKRILKEPLFPRLQQRMESKRIMAQSPIFIPVVLVGNKKTKKVVAMIDTGSYYSMIRPNLANEIGYTFLRDEDFETGAGIIKLPLGKIKKIELDGHIHDEPHVIINQYTAVDFNVGVQVIEDLGLTLDFKNRRIGGLASNPLWGDVLIRQIRPGLKGWKAIEKEKQD